MRFIVDTNPLLRLILDDNLEQVTVVEKLLIKAKNKKVSIIIPQVVIFEINFALGGNHK